jgi:ribosomal protein S21
VINCFVTCEPNESADSMWRKFRKQSERAGVLKDEARHREFIPKSARRAAKSGRARARKAKYESSS